MTLLMSRKGEGVKNYCFLKNLLRIYWLRRGFFCTKINYFLIFVYFYIVDVRPIPNNHRPQVVFMDKKNNLFIYFFE